MITKEITFPDDNVDDVSALINRFASEYEKYVHTKDGIVYSVSFPSSENYQDFLQEFKNFGTVNQ